MSSLAQIPSRDPSPRQEDILEKAYAFLSLLDPDADYFHFQVYGDAKGKGAKEIVGGLYKVGDDLLSHNATGHAVAVAINAIKPGKSRSIREVARIRAIVVDDDIPRQKPRTEWPIPPSIVVQSSPGKFHYYWLCDGLPVSAFKTIQKALVTRYGHDRAVTGPNCVLRLPGFLHQKSKAFQTCIVHANTGRYTAEEILKAFPPASNEPDSKYYVDQLPLAERVALKDGGKYQAEAMAWTIVSYKSKAKIVIRYKVQSGEYPVYLHEYIQVKRIPRLNQFAVKNYSKLHNDLLTLEVANQFDMQHLPMNVPDAYFDRSLIVILTTVKNQRHPKQAGKLIERSKATQYSTVHGIFEAKAK